MKARHSLAAFLALNVIAATAFVVPKETAIATSGFTAVENFPYRSNTYDHLLPAYAGEIDHYQFSTLWNHVAFPQSRGAMVSLLGWPVAEDGPFDYYRYNGSEVAVYYTGNTALFFTVGQ